MQNIRRPVRRTFSEPTSAVAEGLRDHVRLMTTSVQPELALVVVRLSVATANRHGRYVRWTGRRTNTVRTTDLRTLAAGIAFQLVARRRYRRYGVGCNQRENKSVKPIDGKLFDWNTNWRGLPLSIGGILFGRFQGLYRLCGSYSTLNINDFGANYFSSAWYLSNTRSVSISGCDRCR